MRVGDRPLWIIIGAFIAWEFYAHYIAHNRGSHTLSYDVGQFEWWAHPTGSIIVAAVCVILLYHLIREQLVH